MEGPGSPQGRGARYGGWLLRSPWIRGVGVALVLACLGVAPLLVAYQRNMEHKTRCLSNERQLATALLLYSQDYDGRLPRADYRAPDGRWVTWIDTVRPNLPGRKVTVCPSNPQVDSRNPYAGYRYPHSYALNERFWGRFGPGPYPLENLELPAQTAMIVETGIGGQALSWYWDVTSPRLYPAPHSGRMNVAAADGHVTSVKPAHLVGGAGHDPLYGRLGGSMFNWNGGHPNGDTAGPARE